MPEDRSDRAEDHSDRPGGREGRRRPERPPVGRLLETLRVKRNAAVGLGVGATLAAGLYLVRVLELLGPAPDRGSALLFLGLAVVLALSTGGLVATVLTVVTAVRVAGRTEA